MMSQTFELGERRRITLKVWMGNGAPLLLTNCTYQLTSYRYQSGPQPCEVIEESGQYRLIAEIEPPNQGTFKLQYTFELGGEIRKKSVEIRVV